MANITLSDLHPTHFQQLDLISLTGEEMNWIHGGISLCPSPGQSYDDYVDAAIFAGAVAGAIVGIPSIAGVAIGFIAGAFAGWGLGAAGWTICNASQ